MLSTEAFSALGMGATLLGMAGAGLVVVAYVCVRACRTHPADIICIIAVMDVLQSVRLFVRAAGWAHAPDNTRAYSFNVIPDDCNTETATGAVTETAIMAWSGVWCFNMALQVLRPALDTQRLMPAYHVYAWGLCALTLAVLMIHRPLGLTVMGPYKFCWQAELSLANFSLAIDFAVVMLQLAVSLGSVLVAYRRLSVLGTHSEAFYTLLRHVAYVVVFFLIWLAQRITLVLTIGATYHVVVTLLWQMQAFFIALIRFSEPGLLLALLTVLGCRPTHCFSSRQQEHARRLLYSGEHPLEHQLLDLQGEEEAPAKAWGLSDEVRNDLETADTFSKSSSPAATVYAPPLSLPAGDL